jgi:hypothetical protein
VLAQRLKAEGQALPLNFDPNKPFFSFNQDLVEL